MLKKKRKVAEVITISDDTDVNSDSDLPGWLPDGWERVSRWKNNQDISFYYPCPRCPGTTLHTQAEVLRHCLFLCEDAPLKSQAFPRNVQEKDTPRHPQPVQQTKESPPQKDKQKSGSSAEGGQLGNDLFDTIPRGWIIEIRRGSLEDEKMYKFYVDPKKKFRFSSKEEMQFYLKEGKPLYPDSNEISYCNTKSEENIIAEMTFSPEGLPFGWIKEIRYRHCTKSVHYKNGVRKDSYYTDPESGTVFRSIREAERFLSGKVVKQARVPRQSITDFYSFEGSAEMPENLARRFSSTRGYTSRRSIIDIDDDDDDDDDDDEKIDSKDLMRPAEDEVLKTREEFMEAGKEHGCHTEVTTKTEIVGSNGTTSTGERDEGRGIQQEFNEPLSNIEG